METNHTIQFGPNKYRDSLGIARYINHFCDPNCGIKEKFKLVAMKDICTNEEITYDYEMTENSNWTMNCKCDQPECRKVIGAYNNMPENVKIKYKGYISDWLLSSE